MSEYQLSHEAWVYRRADDAKIVPPLSGLPEDVGSPGWTEYQQWLADGNTPDPADPLLSRRSDVYKLFLDPATGEVAGACKEDSRSAPFLFKDPTNLDFREYLRWLDAGNVPIPADPLPNAPIPPVSAWQIRKALNMLGWRDDVEAFVAQADLTTQDGWHHEQNFYRNDPFVIGAGQVLGKTDEEMDNLFRLADTL